ncbi:MAG: DUF3810 domain-containing protein [Vicinamibacterales bacterium]
MRILRLTLVAAAIATALGPLPPWVVEAWYSRGLYPRVQPLVTLASNLVPIALLDLTAAVLVTGVIALTIRRVRRDGVRIAARRTLVTLVVLAAALYLWFVLLWGLNYGRIPLEHRIAYDPSRVTRDAALKFGGVAIERANALQPASTAPGNETEALSYALADVEHALGATRYAHLGRPKRSLVQWYFRKAAIDGMTNPFHLEIILHPDLLPFERPFVLAHEWAHLAGYADESEANFVAWLTCLNGPPAAQYSGWLSAYEHVAAALPRADQQALRSRLSPAVIADLAAARARVARANPTITNAARGAYDTYLRANRIEEGIANYNLVVRLMLGTTYRDGWRPELRRGR